MGPWYRPDGPFRPLRRWLGFGLVLVVLAAIVTGLTGFLTVEYILLVYFGFPALGFAWAALWFIDMVLAYLKNGPGGPDGTPSTAEGR